VKRHRLSLARIHLRLERLPLSFARRPFSGAHPSKLHRRKRARAKGCHLLIVRPLNHNVANVRDELHQPVIAGHAAIDA